MNKSKLTKHQKQNHQKTIYYENKPCIMKVSIRYDDECNNGHNTFSITGSIEALGVPARDKVICAGCIHEEIAQYFPEFKHLIKWHLCCSDAPMYYIENTLYHASNSTSSKYKAGEPNRWEKILKFKNSHLTHKFPKAFISFLENNKKRKYTILEIPHKNEPNGYQYKPHYTFKGCECAWYECPFDTKDKAVEYCKELSSKDWEIVTVVTGYQEAKKRDFKAARSSAIWEDATDEELSLPSEELKKLLLKRLPKLMEDFKKDIEALGFIY